MAGISAMENSRIWLATAQAAMDRMTYTIALYSAEMSVEIALKGVLIELGVDLPKAHNIVPLTRASLEEKRTALPKEFMEKEQFILDTLATLLDLRPIAGYANEKNIDEKDMKNKARELVKKAEEIVGLCEKAVKHIGRRK